MKETLSIAFKAHHLVVELEYDLVGDPIVEGEVVSDLGVVRTVGHRALEGGGLQKSICELAVMIFNLSTPLANESKLET